MSHKFNKIKLCNQSKNVQMSIVPKSFQPHNHKPKVSAIENIDKRMTTFQIVTANETLKGEVFTLTVMKI